MNHARVAAALVVAATACGGLPEAPPEAEFGPPSDTILTQWAHVPVAAWLGGSRWAVVSGEAAEAVILDFASGARRRLGGRGVEEVRQPFHVFAYLDTAYVADWALRRVTQWTAAGRFVRSIEAPAALRGVQPAARDGAGSFYFEVRPVPGPGGRGLQDSAAVVRSPPDLARFDTVARLSPLDLAEVEDAHGRRFERRVFSGTDRWGVGADGVLWIARVYRHRIQRRTPAGQWSEGPALPDRVIEVSRTDREHFVLQFPEELRAMAERLPYTPIHPPFVQALQTPGGEVWLEKSRPALDTLYQRYQVTDRTGRLSHQVLLRSRTARVIALGDTLALIAEQYRDGVRLMQARIPAPGASRR
jgi:hypothetical protein